MRDGWIFKTLAEVCQIKPPKSQAREKLSDSSLVSFLPMEDLGIDEKLVRANKVKTLSSVVGSYTYFADGDVLLAKITPCFENGKLGIAQGLEKGVGFGSSEYIVFRPDATLSREWLYYYLSRESFRLEGAARMSGAVGHKRVSKEFIDNYLIPLPPLPEQQRIVALLDEAFAGLATAKANAERNLQNARAIFESHLEAVFSQREEGWPTKQLGEVCDFQGGSQPPKSEFVYEPRPGYVRFLQIRDYASDRHLTYIPESSKNRLCSADDIMIGRYGASVGKILTGRAGAYNVALVKAIPDLRMLDRDFFFNYLASGAFQGCLADVAARSAQNGFSKDDIYGFPVPAPPLSEQRMVIEQLNPLEVETLRLTRLYERKLAALEELKKSLLHQAFNGQL
jgi:type I restriction enzyme S subunit